ncbi:riboflavin biosynthesis protein RibD [Beutenbergia cavernae DSM 12333]|uniref:Riboflavin biosynthesis protein RibD n=1 Tax=Beutenbergia cavernae (strain ATCC BAA-8 / DSM 12333 / CCUG 43141 / JCM 11478 / NBRC 16432 / NCIMB 13614 / HKI 0122) TaxID=471853 RepID=C5C4U5_BEUC1|nr:dihydrofolate reductase family protein [Beutenbergia cavernae]ACQ80073.1 riboflavin biosynthesis protein RibD [Beutenbergia cavernae DSM 12333]
MGKTVLDMSISVDGFVAGPNETIDNGLGDGGQRLHDWGLPRDADGRYIEGRGGEIDAAMMAAYESAGASVCGRGTVDPAGGWGGDAYDGPPVFIYARRPPRSDELRWSKFTYVDTVEDAVGRAREKAGDADVVVQGAGTGQAAIAAGLIDEIQLHVMPLLLRDGRRLFDLPGGVPTELDLIDVRQGVALHLRYEVRR